MFVFLDKRKSRAIFSEISPFRGDSFWCYLKYSSSPPGYNKVRISLLLQLGEDMQLVWTTKGEQK